MRHAVMSLLASFACLPSVDLALPRPAGSEGIVLVDPDGNVQTVAYGAQVRFALEDAQLTAVTLPHSIEALQLTGPFANEGPRELVTETTTVWVGVVDEDRYVWTQTEERPSLRAPAFDILACVDRPGTCVRVARDGHRWCDAECKVDVDPSDPQPPTPPAITIEAIEDLDCGSNDAQLDLDRCAPLAVCSSPGTLPDDLPAGTTYDVPLGEDVNTAIDRESDATVFVLPDGSANGRIVADRFVHLWARCPERAGVASITLQAGGTVGRIRSDAITVVGSATVTKSIIKELRITDGHIHVTDTRVDSRLHVENSHMTGRRIALIDDAELVISGSVAELEHIVGVDDAIITVGAESEVHLTDVWLARAAVRDSAITIVDSTARITRLYARFAMTLLAFVRSDVRLRDARLNVARTAIRIAGGSVHIDDLSVDRASLHGVLAHPTESTTKTTLHLSRYEATNTTNALLTRPHTTEPAELDVVDVRVRDGGTGIEINPNTTATVHRFHMSNMLTAVLVDHEAKMTLTDLRIDGAKEALRISSSSPTTMTRMHVSNATFLLQVRAPPATVPAAEVVLRDLRASDSSGAEIQPGATLNLEEFVFERGSEAALRVIAPGGLYARNGRISGYTVGLSLDTEAGTLEPETLELHEVEFAVDVEDRVFDQ